MNYVYTFTDIDGKPIYYFTYFIIMRNSFLNILYKAFQLNQIEFDERKTQNY